MSLLIERCTYPAGSLADLSASALFIEDDVSNPQNSYVDPVTGRRSDTASRYLYPHADNPNLTIMVGKRVKRVIVEYV